MPKEIFLNWQLWAVLAAVFAAMTALLAKTGVEGLNPDFATMIRTYIIAVLTTSIVLATGAWRNPGPILGKPLVFLTLSGLATGASWLCYFRALKLGDASRVAPIDKLSVPLVAIFAVLLLGERLSPLNTLGVVLITVGAVLVAVNA